MAGLLFYRFFVLPLWLLWLVPRQVLLVLRGQMSWGDLGERFGRLRNPPERAVWIHGASLGELGPARHLVNEILARDETLGVVVTANTVHALGLVHRWNLPRVTGALAPLDSRFAVRRFLRRFHCALHITIENELWPNRFILLERLHVPNVAISARISNRSVKQWRLLGSFPRRLLALLTLVAPQGPDSRANLLALGLPPDRLLPDFNLKTLVRGTPPDPERLAQLQPAFVRDRTVLLASTHDDEEAQLLPAWARLVAGEPDLRLIIAPRRADRGPGIAEIAQGLGLSTALRSRNDPPVAQVYIADTHFEMPLWYTMAAITFVGGSLADFGGHTPFEPAAYKSVVLHGHFTSNFLDIYRSLDSDGGAIQVTAESFGDEVSQLLRDPGKRAQLCGKALLTVESKNGALSPFLDTFVPSKARTP